MTNAQTSADFSRGVSLGGQARDFKLPPSQRSQSLGRSINSIDGRWCGPAADRRPHVTTADQERGDALGIKPSDEGWNEHRHSDKDHRNPVCGFYRYGKTKKQRRRDCHKSRHPTRERPRRSEQRQNRKCTDDDIGGNYFGDEDEAQKTEAQRRSKRFAAISGKGVGRSNQPNRIQAGSVLVAANRSRPQPCLFPGRDHTRTPFIRAKGST